MRERGHVRSTKERKCTQRFHLTSPECAMWQTQQCWKYPSYNVINNIINTFTETMIESKALLAQDRAKHQL